MDLGLVERFWRRCRLMLRAVAFLRGAASSSMGRLSRASIITHPSISSKYSRAVMRAGCATAAIAAA